MAVFYINTTVMGKGGGRFAFPFDTPYGSIDELAEAFRQHRIVNGDRLETVDDGRGGKMVRQRERLAVGIDGVATISACLIPIWEPE